MKDLKKILTVFVKAIDKLEQLAQDKDKAVLRNTAVIDAMKQDNLGLIAESQAAKNIKERIAKLLDQEA